MSDNTKARVKEILRNCCAGNASLATDILHEEFIIIARDKLPEVHKSDSGNGWVTALAQENFQPQLALHPADGDVPGEWSRKIAYANLAIAEAVEATARVEEAELTVEAFTLYRVYATQRGIAPMDDWESLTSANQKLAAAYLAVARTARNLHRKA